MKGLKELSAGKRFLMSLLATTVSIVLTFGTTAIVDRKKQRAEKREMVLMVMYDMRESLQECEQCQENMDTFCDLQVDLVAHPEKFSASVTNLLVSFPIYDGEYLQVQYRNDQHHRQHPLCRVRLLFL